MGKTLLAIGEALIDFIPSEKGCSFDEVPAFFAKVGGAPTNVLGAFAKLGGKTELLTQLGNDPFGHKIINALKFWNIGTDYVKFTDKANTALAFVSLGTDGDRTFSFYRNPSADMLYSESDIKKEWFDDCFALHFCSVSLGDAPMKDAHKKAISYAHDKGAIVSFDLNLRFSLWKEKELLKRTVWDFMPQSHIVKLSDEELEFVCDCDNIMDAKDALLCGNTKLILYTMGAKGAYAITENRCVYSEAKEVKVTDTTGAGDAFCGSFLYNMCKDGVGACDIDMLTGERLKYYLDCSNKYCSRSVQKNGAIESYPTEF